MLGPVWGPQLSPKPRDTVAMMGAIQGVQGDAGEAGLDQPEAGRQRGIQ